MKKQILTFIATAAVFGASAQTVTATWQLSDPDNLPEVSLTGDEDYLPLVSTSFQLGDNIARVRQITASGADSGFEPVEYVPPFAAFTPTTRVTSKTAGHCIAVSITPQDGHKFKPTSISFDAAKIGTDTGSISAYYQVGDEKEKSIRIGIAPLRNKITSTNKTAYSHFEYTLGDVITDSKPVTMYLYLMNINGIDKDTAAKELAIRNITVTGEVDEELAIVSSFVKGFSANVAQAPGEYTDIDLFSLISDLRNGDNALHRPKIFGAPADFKFDMVDGYSAVTSYNDMNTLDVDIMKGEKTMMSFSLKFQVTNRQPKPEAKPLNRGLMSLSLTGANMGTGNLVSWRHREADGYGVKYKLYRGDASSQDVALNDGLYIIDRTNFNDKDGTADSYYLLETYDKAGVLLESEVSRKTWDNQTFYIPTETPANSSNGATYTPNDASYCDMDGDGEYEIILKWSPSDEKDAASSGATSPAIF
ncbi:MAG: hypothetical protein K2J49_06785, partial [Muribaculaceae bacterium]|nr:hypothetical protein [Muribaculaceae bacterium]